MGMGKWENSYLEPINSLVRNGIFFDSKWNTAVKLNWSKKNNLILN